MSTPQSHSELIHRVSSSRRELRSVFEMLAPEHFAAIPGPQATRSAKDLMAHIAWWEEFVMWRVLMVKSGEPIEQLQNLDLLNDQVYQLHRDLTLEQVQELFDLSESRMQAFLERQTWEEISGGVEYLGGTLLAVIASNTYEHYEEHLPGLQAFAESVRKV